MAHAYKPKEFIAKQQVKQAYEAHKQANPAPSSVPVLAEQVRLLAQVLGVA